MNKLIITGNLTRDPELRTTDSGLPVCNFTVAVNRSRKQNEADYIRVTAWRELGNICSTYLSKGKKVGVVGPAAARAYVGSDGNVHAVLELTADEVEFLSPKDKPQQDRGDAYDEGYYD